MVIVFCEKCGKRVSETDIAAGQAVKTAENSWLCGGCAPRRAAKPPPPARATSGVATLPASSRRATPTPAPAQPVAAAAHDAPRQKPGARLPASVILGAGGGVCFLLALVILLSHGKRGEEVAAVPPPEKPSSTMPLTPPQTKPLGVTGSGSAPAGDRPLQATGASPPAVAPLSLSERAKQAEKEMEDFRNQRTARLLEEHKAWFSRNSANAWGYRRRLREFIASNRSTPAAAEAERLIAELKPPSAVRSRFVRVENLGQKRVLSLAEVQVFSDGKNVAPAGKATQSSVTHGGDPHRAIDGNTDGVYGNNSVTHTNDEDAPWWEVDLGGDKDIEGLVVWNRTECIDRLQNFRVSLLDGERKTVWETTVADIPRPKVEFGLGPK